MGREAVAVCRWQGDVAEAKILLESQEIILRGDVRARIARGSITGARVDGDDLVVTAAAGELVVELGSIQAAKWAAAILKAPPTLASKLGIDAARRAFVIGVVADATLADALDGATTDVPGEAAVLVAVVLSDAELAAAFAVAETLPTLAVWCVYGKGKAAITGDGAVRAFMRSQGYVDSKSCAVSGALTATRYGRVD
jgi:hypothetical protein